LADVSDQEPALVQRFDILPAEVLHTAIGVVNAPRGWLPRGNRLLERGERERRIDVFGDRPTDHFAREQIQDHGEVDKSVLDADIRQIACPRLIDPGQAPPRQQIGIDAVGVLRIGGVHESTFDLGLKRKTLHHPA